MRWTLAARIGMGALLLAGCSGQASDGPVAVRIASVFEDDPEVAPVERSAPLARVEWRFDTPEGQKSESSATRGWKAAQGVSGLTVREGRLTGRTTSAVPVVHVERSSGPFDADPLHAIELRMRVSTGTTLAVTLDGAPELNVEEVLGRAQAFQLQATTPLVPGDELQTYTLSVPRPLAAVHPDIVVRLSKQLQSWRERVEAERLPSDADAADSLSADDLKRLKALGYIE